MGPHTKISPIFIFLSSILLLMAQGCSHPGGRYASWRSIQRKKSTISKTFQTRSVSLSPYEGANRKVASIKTKEETTPWSKMSKRNIYFLTLWGQHQQLSWWLRVQGEKNIRVFSKRNTQDWSCPQFHHALQSVPQPSFSRAQKTGYTKFKKEEILETLNNINEEISILCEYGYGQNYYIFANMIPHMKSDFFVNRSKKMALKTLFKLNIAANIDLTHQLQTAKNPFEQELLKRLNMGTLFQ